MELPNDTADPFIVILELANLELAIDPANCAFVIPVPNPLTLAGNVTVFEPISNDDATLDPVTVPAAGVFAIPSPTCNIKLQVSESDNAPVNVTVILTVKFPYCTTPLIDINKLFALIGVNADELCVKLYGPAPVEVLVL